LAGSSPAGGFRPDINGLRAIAIAAVVAFHLAKATAPGGFVGVDVFFVISGYLMTKIIMQRLEAGRFRVGAFYLERLRRIGPALAVLCAGLWLAGATLLDPWTFQRLAAKLPFALLFVSNVAFANRGGYFADDSNGNWLLHTWSLSVEWQFYLLHPLVLLAIFAWPPARRHKWKVLGGVAAASFALAAALSSYAATLDFYLLPTRAWELLAGGFCVGLEQRLRLGAKARAFLHAAGLVLIGIGVAVARPDTGWPSFLTLLPTGGTAAVIAGRLDRTFWAENAAVDALGRASYSIYLWHWPIIVWLYDAGIEITWPTAVGALAAMLALGAASYWLVERRLTQWIFRRRPWRWAFASGVAALTLVLSGVAAATNGLEPLRTLGAPRAVRQALLDDRRAADDWAYPRVCAHYQQRPVELCRMGDPSARRVLVLGDSQAEQLAPRYAHAFDVRPGEGVTFSTIAGCIPMPGVDVRGSPDCGEAWTRLYRFAEGAGYARVIIAANWPPYFDQNPGAPLGITTLAPLDGASARRHFTSLDELATAEFDRLADEIRRMQARGIQVVLVGTTLRDDAAAPRALYAQAFWTGQVLAQPMVRTQYERSVASIRERLRQLSRTTGAPLIDPLDGLCAQGLCPVMSAGRTIYKDVSHLRASALSLPRFAYIDPWIAPAAAPMRLK